MKARCLKFSCLCYTIFAILFLGILRRIRGGAVQIRGSIDRIDGGLIEGWITIIEAPELKIALEIWLGDDLIGRTAADRFRPDLLEHEIGDGQCAFRFEVPSFIANPELLKDVRFKFENSDVFWVPEKLPDVAPYHP